MSKIVYLTEQPLDERNYERFGIATWIARGWAVEVWDLTPLAHPRVWDHFNHSGRELCGFEAYFPILSRSQLYYRCSGLDKTAHFIDLTGDNLYTIEARLRLRRTGATRIVCATGSIPAASDAVRNRGFARKLMSLRSRGFVGSLNLLSNAILVRLAGRFTRPDLSIASGAKSFRASRAARCEILQAHNLDYDIYLRLRTSIMAPSSEDYGVFLDQNICFAPDFIYEGIPPYATPERYFRALRDGLRKISSALGVPIRVAAHPRAPRHGEYEGYFEGMRVEYGRAAQLIGNCRFAVCHYSTALQFAVLFNKPVIFVTTDELVSSRANEFIGCFASALGKSVINLERDLDSFDWQNELRVDCQKYDEYRKEYVKADGSPELPHWDIVADYLEKSRGEPSNSPQPRACAEPQ